MKDMYLTIVFLLALTGSTNLLGQKNDLAQAQRFNIEKELRKHVFSDQEFEHTPGLLSVKKAAMSVSHGDVPPVSWAMHFGGSGNDYV